MSYPEDDIDLAYKAQKEHIEYWKLPEDKYEIPPTLLEWGKIDPQMFFLASNKSVRFTLANPKHPFRAEVDKFHTLQRRIAQSVSNDDAMSVLYEMNEVVKKFDAIRDQIKRVEQALDDEIQLQSKDYAKWLVDIIEAFLAKPDIESWNFLCYCRACHTSTVNAKTTFENCHLGTKIAIRNTAAYLYCYDKTGMAETFLEECNPSRGTYLFLLHTYMKKNKQTIVNDKTAPIHQIRIKYDGDHISAIVGDLVTMKKSIHKFQEKEVKKQKMNQQ